MSCRLACGGGGDSARAELAIAGIAETGHNVGDLVKPFVDGRSEQPHVWRSLLQRRDSFWRRNHTASGWSTTWTCTALNPI